MRVINMKKISITPLAQSHLVKGYVCVQFNADQIYLHAPEKEIEDVVCYDDFSSLELLDLGLAELMDTHHGQVKTYDEKELVAAHENGETWVAELNLIAEVSVDNKQFSKEMRIDEFNRWRTESRMDDADICAALGISKGAYTKFRNGTRLMPVEMIIAIESMAKNEPPSLGRLTTMQQRIVKAAMDNVAFGDSHGNC
jgi:hypothetical protein